MSPPPISARRRPGPVVPALALAICLATLATLPPPPPPLVAVADVQPPHVWQAGVLRVGMDGSYPPFAYLDRGVLTGHDVEISRRLAAYLGLRLEIVDIPFDGLYDALRVSRIDVIVSALPRMDELTGAVIYSRPYFEAGDVLVTRATSSLRSSESLAGRRVGAEMGSLGDQAARREVGRRQFRLDSSFVSLDAALDALRDGRVDAVAVDRVSALMRLRTEPGLVILEPPLASAPYVIAVPFDAPDVAARVDHWLDELERSGHLRQLQVEFIG